MCQGKVLIATMQVEAVVQADEAITSKWTVKPSYAGEPLAPPAHC